MSSAMSDSSGGGAHSAGGGATSSDVGATTTSASMGDTAAGGATTYTASGERASSDASIGQLINNISTDLSTLMRQEVALAKAELKQEASKAGQAAGMLGAAGFAGYFLLLFASLALAWALSAALGAGWAHLIVAGLWALLAAVLFVLGRKRLQQVNPKPEQTMETVSEIPSALKPN